LVPNLRDPFPDLTARDDEVVIRARVEPQDFQYDFTDERTTHIQYALIGSRERTSRREPHRAAEIVVIQRAKVLGEDRQLLQFLRRRRGGVVDLGELT
jgi:hypothetical protein